jgi:hypothetical protein
MIYLNTYNTTLVTVNGTTDTTFTFTNNQTNQSYTIDLWVVGMLPNGSARKQVSFYLNWTNGTSNEPTKVIDGINYIEVPQGEYNYMLGDTMGIMKLVAPVEVTTYENQNQNKVYNG